MESQESLEEGGRRVQVRDVVEKQRVLSQEAERQSLPGARRRMQPCLYLDFSPIKPVLDFSIPDRFLVRGIEFNPFWTLYN